MELGQASIKIVVDDSALRAGLETARSAVGAFDRSAAASLTGTKNAVNALGSAVQNLAGQMSGVGGGLDGISASAQALAGRIGAASTASAASLKAIGTSADDVLARINAVSGGIRGMSSIAPAVREVNAAISGQAVAMRDSASSAQLSAFQLQNLSYQMQDLGQAILSGQPLFRTFIQQGSQISQIYGPGAGVAASLKSVGTGIVAYITNPLNLAVLGFATLAGGAQLLFSLISGAGANAEKVWSRHEDALRSIRALLEDNTAGVNRFGAEVQRQVQFTGLQDQASLQRLLNQQMLDAAVALDGLKRAQAGLFTPGPFENLINEYFPKLIRGTADVKALNDEIRKIALAQPANQALQDLAGRLLDMTEAASSTIDKIRELRGELNRLPARMAETSSMEALSRYQTEQAATLERLNRQRDAEIQSLRARSPLEQRAAAEARESATALREEESAEERRTRIRNAGTLAYERAVRSLEEATRTRVRALDEAVAGQQHELDLIGQSVGEVARLKFEYEKLAELQRAAADAGVNASQAEIDAIRATAEAMGELAQQVAEKNVVANLDFERSLIGLSDAEKAVASALHDLYGADWQSQVRGAIADQIRFNETLKKAESAAEDFASAVGSAIGDLFSKPIKDFEDFLDRITSGFARISQQIISSGIRDLLMGRPVAGLSGGLSIAMPSVTASMPVLPTSTGANGTDMAMAAMSAAVESGVTRAVRSSGGLNVSAYITEAALARGIEPAIALAVAKSEGGIDGRWRVGDAGKSFGPYQLYTGGGLGNVFQQQTGLPLTPDTIRQQIDFALDRAAQGGWGPWYGWKGDKWAGITRGATPPANDNGVVRLAPIDVAAAPAPQQLQAAGSGGIRGFLQGPGGQALMAGIGGFSLGYQSQSPLMGGLGGALQGLMSGGLIGALIGGIGGLVGGLIGKAIQAKKDLEAAQKAWKDMQGQLDAFLGQLNDAGPLGTALRSARDQMQKFIEAAEKAKAPTEEIDRLKKELEEFTRRMVRDFVAGFDVMTQAMRMGLGANSPAVAAAANVLQVGKTIKQFLDDTRTAAKEMGMDPGKALAAATEAAKKYALSLLDPPRALSEVETRFLSIQGTAAQLGSVLQDLGMSAKDAADAVNKGVKAALDALRKDFTEGLTARLNEATGKGYINQLNALVKQGAQDYNDARLLGLDPTLVGQVFAAEAQKIIDGANLTGDAFDALIKQFPQLAGVVHQATGDLKAFQQQIKEYLDSLNVGQLSPLDPLGKLNAAQAAYQRQLALAQGGDTQAHSTITRYSDDLLNAARDFYASSQGYTDIFETISGDLRNLAQIDELGDPIVEAIDGASAGAIKNALRMLDYQAKQLAATDGIAAAIRDLEISIRSSIDPFRELRPHGYAAGGWVTGGTAGRDSVPAMLMPGEYVTPARRAATGRFGPAGNDNTDVRELVVAVKQLIRLTAESGSGQMETTRAGLAEVRTALDRLNQTTREVSNREANIRASRGR